MKPTIKNLQHTIRTSINAVDNSHPSGKACRMTLRPAPVNSGILFRRTDCDPAIEIAASWQQLKNCRDQVTLQSNGVEVSKVSLLLATCLGLGIDNLLVDVEGPEMPLSSGHASTYVFLLQSAGLQQQHAKRICYGLGEVFSKRLSQGWLKLSPANDLSIMQTGHRLNGMAHVSRIDRARFVSEIGNAGLVSPLDTSETLAQRQLRNRLVLQVMAQLALLPGRLAANCSLFQTDEMPELLHLLPELVQALRQVDKEPAGYLHSAGLAESVLK